MVGSAGARVAAGQPRSDRADYHGHDAHQTDRQCRGRRRRGYSKGIKISNYKAGSHEPYWCASQCSTHPELVTLLAAWTAANLAHIRACRRLAADHRGPLNRYQIGRIAGRAGRSCGVSVHPHQLRHTLATQAINRGMRLEAIAALLGHRTMEMTLIYAHTADRVVADEYQAISEKIDALYGQQPELPADYETTGMAKLRREAHARMLGNGLCTRPA
jgi:hypothetical protein